MRDYNETDRNILALAKKMLLSNGLLNTDMKDIAKELGCSRSTLYRHFSSKGDILIILATDALKTIRDSLIIPDGFRFVTGYDAFCWQLNSMMDGMIHHVDDITFLRDFDCFYTSSYPGTTNTEAFLKQVTKSTYKSPLQESFDRGMKDGSIRQVNNPELCVLTIVHSCIALAQRTLPREQHFIEEYGYGQEILREQVKILTDYVKG